MFVRDEISIAFSLFVCFFFVFTSKFLMKLTKNVIRKMFDFTRKQKQQNKSLTQYQKIDVYIDVNAEM